VSKTVTQLARLAFWPSRERAKEYIYTLLTTQIHLHWHHSTEQSQNLLAPCLAAQAMELSHKAAVQSGSRRVERMVDGCETGGIESPNEDQTGLEADGSS